MKIFDSNGYYCTINDKRRLARLIEIGDILRLKGHFGLFVVRKFTRNGLPWLRRCDEFGDILPHIPTGHELRLDDSCMIYRRVIEKDLFEDRQFIEFDICKICRPSGRFCIGN